ncbi:ABC transporter permease subunit [Stetteria hydrogenophila]
MRGWLGAAAAAAVLAMVAVAAHFTSAGALGVAREVIGVFTSPSGLEAAVKYMGPITCSAAGLTLAYRAGFITIGSEGQVLLGSAAALWLLAYAWPTAPRAGGVAAALALAALVGAAWGSIPGLLRVYARVNEVLSSLMLNYVALSALNYLIAGPWRAGAFTATRPVPDEYSLGYLHIAVVVVAAAVLFEFIRARTKLGVAAEAYGAAVRAAETYTLPRRTLILAVAVLSGAAAGLGGGLMMLSFQRSFQAMSQPPGYGYMGVLVAWLSGTSALATLPVSLFFSALVVAGYSLQALGVPFNFVLLTQAMAVLAAALLKAGRGVRSG